MRLKNPKVKKGGGNLGRKSWPKGEALSLRIGVNFRVYSSIIISVYIVQPNNSNDSEM